MFELLLSDTSFIPAQYVKDIKQEKSSFFMHFRNDKTEYTIY